MQMDKLAQIVLHKREEIARRRRHPYRSACTTVRDGAAIVQALRRPAGEPLRVIAEIKFRSPSRGVIRARTVGAVATLAQAYRRGGASALSVLADQRHFGGTPLDVRRAGRASGLPVLYKGFVLDPLQVELAARAEASMVLLIVRCLRPETLGALIEAAERWGLVPLVEVASATELEVALDSPASVIGVNARDLRNFTLDRNRAARLVAAIPSDRLALWLSGVRDKADFRQVAASRADAVLIGEGLMRTGDPETQLRSWREDAACGG
ncbi:MAG: indole-3-glycerol phosphate synthase TrpC [Polyangiales bacterium]